MSKSEEKRVPELRFKGFTEDWEQRKLSTVFTKLKSYSLSRNVEVPEETGTKYVHYGDIHKKIADKIYDDSSLPNIIDDKFEKLDIGDIILADASEDYQGIAEPAIILEKNDLNYVAGLHTIALRPINISSLFLYYLFKTNGFRRHGYRTGTGMKVFGITSSNVLDYSTFFPIKSEQYKISNFLFFVDKVIALHQRKKHIIEKFEKVYQSYLFPSRKEPLLKFSDEHGKWKKYKLSEITVLHNRLRVPISSSMRVAGDIPYYGANGIVDYVEGMTHEGEFILVAEDAVSDITNYPIFYVNGRIWVNNHAHVLSAKDERMTNEFLMYSLKNVNFLPYLVGSGRTKLTIDSLLKIEIQVPKLELQIKLSRLLSELRNKKQKEEKIIEYLLAVKKVYLQKLLI